MCVLCVCVCMCVCVCVRERERERERERWGVWGGGGDFDQQRKASDISRGALNVGWALFPKAAKM